MEYHIIQSKENKIKTFEQIYKLNEKIYDDTKKVYYHVSPNAFTEFKASNRFRAQSGEKSTNKGGVFITPELFFAQEFGWSYGPKSTKDNKHIRYVYKCLFKKPLNIFDGSSQEDRFALLNLIKKNPLKFYVELRKGNTEVVEPSDRKSGYKHTVEDIRNIKHVLYELFSAHDWYLMENSKIIKAIRSLGYDGLVTTEMNCRNLMIFDADNLEIIKWSKDSPTIWKEIDFYKNPTYQITGERSHKDKSEWIKDKDFDWNKSELKDIRDKHTYYSIPDPLFRKNHKIYDRKVKKEITDFDIDDLNGDIFYIETKGTGEDYLLRHGLKFEKCFSRSGTLNKNKLKDVLKPEISYKDVLGKIDKAKIKSYIYDDKTFKNQEDIFNYIVEKFK